MNSTMMVSTLKILRVFALYTVYSFIKTNKALSRELLNKVENNLKPHNFEDQQEINFDSKGHLIWFNKDADEYATKNKNKLINMSDTEHRVKVDQRDNGILKKRNDSKIYHLELTNNTADGLQSYTQNLKIHQTHRNGVNLSYLHYKEFPNNLNLYNMTPVENQEDWLANSLRTNVRVLCLVELTKPQEIKQRWHIMITWGKRCSKLLFFSTQHQPFIPIVKLSKTGSTWDVTKEAISYLYNNSLSDADWFLRTDDETYVIMENLRYMLSTYNPNEPLYFGLHYNVTSKAKKFTTERAGYVLSRKAVEKFGFSSPLECNGGLDMCLMQLFVKTIDTRDSLGRGRFLFTPNPFSPDQKLEYYLSYLIKDSLNKSMIRCSDFAISFHQIFGDQMHMIEYVVYHLRPYGVRFAPAHHINHPGMKIVNRFKKISSTQFIVEAYLKERDRIYADWSVADDLARRVRVLCWVMTCPKYHEKRAMHVKATWGRRCNILLFMSTELDPSLPTISLPVEGGYEYLWGKTKAAFRYVYEHHLGDADWFMKVDDDTFVIVENLRYMLSKYNANDPLYIGLRYKMSKHYFMAGGPGYVLSRAALDKLVTAGLPDPSLCSVSNLGSEDVEMGSCLANIGVKAMDSRDSMHRSRFFNSKVIQSFFLSTEMAFILKSMSEDRESEGLQCCSKYAVSFHNMSAAQMYAMEYLVYHLKPYGYFWNGTEPEELLSLKLDFV